MNIDVDLWRRRIREDTFSKYHYEMGRAIQREGDFAAAADAYRRALAIRSDYPEASFRLASLLEQNGQPELSREVETQARAFDPHYPAGALHGFALEACERGDHAGALAVLKKAFALNQELKPHFDLARSYFELATEEERETRFAEATARLQEGVRLWPDYVSFWELQGFAQIGVCDFASAERSFARGLALDPVGAKMHSGLGWIGICTGRLDEAARRHARAVALAPQSIPILCFANFLHCARGDVAAAEANMERAYALSPENISVLVQRAITAFMGGRLAAAETMFRQILLKWPDYGFAESNFALVLDAMGRSDEAMEMHKRSIPHLGERRRSLQMLRPWAATALAKAYRQLGLDDAA